MSKENSASNTEVSVVMPAYNSARTLMEAVNSVLMQTHENLELIICNDASTDETGALLNNISDKRVKIIQNPRNLGEGRTRDHAINLAQGEWLAVIDSDDVWAPERMEVMLREVTTSKNKIVFDDIYECHDTPSGMVPWHRLRGKYAFGCNGKDSLDLAIENFISSKRLLIKPLLPLTYVKRNNVRHRLQYGADIDFFLQLLAHGLQLTYIPKAMYYYRLTPGSMSASANHFISMRETLEKAVYYFEHAPKVQEELINKIGSIKRKEQYLPIIQSLKNKNFILATQQLIHSPWLIPDSIPRLYRAVIYHIHRLIHGGISRGTH